MNRDDLVEIRATLRDLLDYGPIDIDDLPTGSRLLMLDAADFADDAAYRLREAVSTLADRDGL